MNSIGELDEIRQIAPACTRTFTGYYKEGLIAGYRLLVMHDQEKIDNNYILADLSKATEDRFPFIYLAVQYEGEEEQSIALWLKEKGFVKVTS